MFFISSALFTPYGISDTNDAIEEVLTRIQDDSFDEGPNP